MTPSDENLIGSKYLSNKTSELTNKSLSDMVSMKLLSNVSIENMSLRVPKVYLVSAPKSSSIIEIAVMKNKSLQEI
jgi:hypothetical protein